MTVDFDKIASDATKEYEERKAAEEEKRRDSTSARAAVVQLGIKLLDAFAIPILEAAQSAFARQNVDVGIERSYDVLNFTSKMPSIDVQMSRLAPNRSNGYRIKSPILFVSSDGERIFAHFSTEHGSRPEIKKGDALESGIEVLLGNAISDLAGLFYRAVEKTH